MLDVAISPDDQYLVTTSDDSTLRVWDTGTLELLAEHQTTMGGYWSMSYLPDGSGLVVGDISGQLSVFEPESRIVSRSFESNKARTARIDISPDGRMLAAGSADALRLWSIPSGRLIGELHGPGGPVTSAPFMPDGTGVVSGSNVGTALVWVLRFG